MRGKAKLVESTLLCVSLNCYFETKQGEKFKNLTDTEQERTSEPLIAKLKKQQDFFNQALHIRAGAVKTSSVISREITKKETVSHSLMVN